MRRGALLLLLSASLSAADLEGSIADAGRWNHPRGPAAGCGRSRDRGPDSFGGIAWSFRPKGAILAPPLTWDGALFVLHGAGAQATLQALDAETGRSLASIAIPTPAVPSPAAWNRSVLLPEGKRLVEYRLLDTRLVRRWSFEAAGNVSAPRAVAGEVYVTTPQGLLRLRLGARAPVWTAPGAFVGEPAVLGDHVYALLRRDRKTWLSAHRRADGSAAGECAIEDAEAQNGEIAAAEGIVAARAGAQWALVARKAEGDRVSLALDRREKFLAPPLVNRTFALAPSDAGEISVFSVVEPKLRPIVTKKERPDLLQGIGAPVSASGAVSFGPFALDFGTMDVVWSVEERKEGAAYRAGFRFGVVPNAGMALAVTKDGKALLAFASEAMGS